MSFLIWRHTNESWNYIMGKALGCTWVFPTLEDTAKAMPPKEVNKICYQKRCRRSHFYSVNKRFSDFSFVRLTDTAVINILVTSLMSMQRKPCAQQHFDYFFWTAASWPEHDALPKYWDAAQRVLQCSMGSLAVQRQAGRGPSCGKGSML